MANIKIDWRGLAKKRVGGSDALQQYEDIIFYNWPDYETHLQWIVTGKEKDILEWAEEIAGTSSGDGWMQSLYD